MTHRGELPIPPIAKSDLKAREIARIWGAGGKQHVALATGLWKDPATWGICLVDLAKHIANAYMQSEGRDYYDTLNRIREGMKAEWASPTDDPAGDLL